MTLNRWQRIGIVISVLWILGAAFYERGSQVDSATSSAQSILRMCLDTEGAQSKNCNEEFGKNFVNFLEPNWGDIAFIAFAPAILGWILVFIIIRVYRWIKAGKV